MCVQVSLTYLWRRLSSIGVDVSAVWASITSLVLKSLLCVEDLIPYQPNAFEVPPPTTLKCTYPYTLRARGHVLPV